MSKKKKGNGGVVYSTNSDYDYNQNDDFSKETLKNNEQKLYVRTDRLKGNKTLTVVEGFVGDLDDLKDLGKLLKSKCGVGGTVKADEVLIQGDFRDKIFDLLLKEGYSVKKKGG